MYKDIYIYDIYIISYVYVYFISETNRYHKRNYTA